MKLVAVFGLTLAWTFVPMPSHAEEKNGIQLTVTRKTLERADSRTGYYYADRIDRTQGLRVVAKNVSFKPMPAGEIDWTILVRKYYSSAIESYSGKEKLKALKPAEATEMTIGYAQIYGWKDYSSQGKDTIEYEVVVTHDGKETVRTSSTSNFEVLEKRATKKAIPKAK
jgi:hypothetical protein